jgi:ankyrin repeat protein
MPEMLCGSRVRVASSRRSYTVVSIAALWEAIRKNQVDAVERLLDSGMSVLATDEHANTAAHLAAEAGNLAILRLLRERGAPLDRLNWIDQSPLSLAAWKGHLSVVKYLCAQGAPTHGPNLNTAPLGTAAAAGHLEIVKYLVEQRHVPLNALERPFGATPLFVAASFFQLDVVRYLMARGADPTMPNAQGETACSRVKHIMQLPSTKPTSAKAKLFNDLVACLGGNGVNAARVDPPRGTGKGSNGLLSYLIKPKKEWHFWL